MDVKCWRIDKVGHDSPPRVSNRFTSPTATKLPRKQKNENNICVYPVPKVPVV